MTLESLERIRTYSVLINDRRIPQLISWYVKTLQKAIDIIWKNVGWKIVPPRVVESKNKLSVKISLKLHQPTIPKSSSFKRSLRNELMKDNPYASHWVDAVIRTAYSIMEGWRKRYLRGKARRVKPRVTRGFARCKITLMKVDYEKKTIRITLKPYEYIEVSYADAWFFERVNGWRIGEVILKDNRVLIPFKKVEAVEINDIMVWDCNELELTGFSPKVGFIHVDLRPLITTRIICQGRRSKAQEIASKKLRIGRKLLEKYSGKERNKCSDVERKIAVQIVRAFPSAMHVFERLNKEDMISKGRNGSKWLRKRIARISWMNIIREVKRRAIVKEVNPKDTSKTCSRCGCKVKDPRGQIFKCPRCKLVIDRQKNASVNIYLKKMGFPHCCKWWDEVVKPLIHHELWVGVALMGTKPMIWSPMKGDLMAVKPKAYIGLSKPM
ncbi:MAG: IS200/IS605 family element transposase accessory protein TnpB [Candidatus Methanomethyliales bacterium]|nr:IS200/IS605 family element transposase accessory protein TnpB [Candidatus Methanomethylicales archaeon]